MADSKSVPQSQTAKKKKTKSYPAPFIVPPSTQHTQSILFLHGRGSNGEKFGLELLASKRAAGTSLQEHFSGMKFIFPTAKKRRAKSYNRALINQWFDDVPINEQINRMSRDEIEWRLEGLTETAEFSIPVLNEEVGGVGAKNVFLGGLSQGCAMGLHMLLSYPLKESEGACEGESLAGFVGMSGWLPFAEDIRDLIGVGERKGELGETDDEDPFASSDGVGFAPERSRLSSAMQICNFVRENMDITSLNSTEPPFLQTPVFLGHGKRDEKVNINFRREAATILKEVGMQVRWEE